MIAEQTKPITITEAKAKVLRITGLTEGDWMVYMFDMGLRFAHDFSQLMSDPAAMEELLTKTPAKDNEPNNWFWAWWSFNWLLNDKEYIDQQVYKQPLSYEQYKCYMIGDEILEKQLLSDIATETI